MLDVDKFCKLRPVLYHLSAAESWPFIQRHGLLSSKQILLKCSVDEERKQEIEKHRLRRSYLLESDGHGSFTLRDRTTLSHAGLAVALGKACSPDQWIDLLNQRVFLFARRTSLENLLRAPLNRELSHILLEVDTRKLFDAYASSIELADINTGYAKRRPAQRGLHTFQASQKYSRTGGAKIIEVTVLRGIPDIMGLLQRTVLRRPDGTEELLYSL